MPSAKSVAFREASGTERADSRHFIDEMIEHEPVRETPARRNDIRVVTAVLGEYQAGASARDHARDGRVEERGVLMRVHDIEAAPTNLGSSSPCDPEVQTGPTVEGHDVHTLRREHLAEGTDGIQTENYGLNPFGQSANDLRNQDFRARNLHHVHHEANSKRFGARRTQRCGRAVQLDHRFMVVEPIDPGQAIQSAQVRTMLSDTLMTKCRRKLPS